MERMLLGRILFLCFMAVYADYTEDDLRISTSSGILVGDKTKILGKEMKIFFGVPYAQPPVAELRFKPPIPLHLEGIVREAKSFAPICFQPPHSKEVINPLLKPNQADLSEDCLYLNIYIPILENNELLPVMIFLTGEGFNYADPQQYDGRFLASFGKVILITLNYRVSVFGFLSSLSNDAPGNVGLLDQRMALKWVKANIENFGGNPEKITLFGRFTGSMSTAIHAFSPLSKDEVLFNKIILHSGVPDGDWVFDRNPLNATFALAEATGCLFNDMSETLTCLRRIPAEILLEKATGIPDAWRPVFDFNLIYETTQNAAASGDYHPVDILIALNNNEGSLCISALKAMKSKYFDKIVSQLLTMEDMKDLVSTYLQETFKETNPFLNKLAVYKYSSENESKVRELFVKFCGDLYVTSHAEKLAEITSKLDLKVYMYELTHRPIFSNNLDFISAGHGDDLIYAFGLPFGLPQLPESEKNLTGRLVKAISNFAYFGNPGGENSTLWPRYMENNRLIMTFDVAPSQAIQNSPFHDSSNFWHEIVPAARRERCPVLPVASALVGVETDEKYDSSKNFFFGTLISVPTAEYMMFTLLCISGILLMIATLAILLLVRIKKTTVFQRLE